MPGETRAYRDGDDDAILDLFARSFPHAPRRPEHLRWKYRQNPFGNQRISLTFNDETRLIGHYAGYAVPFRAYGRDLLAHQIGDTMTDVGSRHLGRGATSVLGRTALDFYARFCEQRVAFNYGFNVSNIQKFSLRFLRSDRVESVSYRTAPPLARLPRLQRWARGYQFEVVRDTTAEWDQFFDRVAGDYRFLVRRDARYVRWRYLDAPDVAYTVVAVRKWRHLVGWIVYRIQGGQFLWGDALFDARFPDAVEVALRHIVPSYPVERIAAWFPRRPNWFDQTLQELGFDLQPEPQDLSVMCVPFTWLEVVQQMRHDLYYSWGDSDLF